MSDKRKIKKLKRQRDEWEDAFNRLLDARYSPAVITFPPGTFVLPAPITITGSVVLRGTTRADVEGDAAT